jgi:hypothetical protein
MAVVRTNLRENPFSQIDRFVFENDETISWKAKGLMGYMLTRPAGWVYNHKDLVNRAKDGKDAVTSALQELTEAGYIDYYQERLPNGKFGKWIYDVYERPEYNPSYNTDLPKAEKPHTDKPHTDKPNTEKADYSNNKDNNTKINNNNFINIDDDEKEPFEINFFAFQEFKKDFEDNFPNTFDESYYSRIIEIMTEKKIDFITYPEAVEQLRYMAEQREKGLMIADSAKYFVGGIELKRTSRHAAMNKAKIKKAEKELKARKEKQELEREANQESRVPFYNWLEQ